MTKDCKFCDKKGLMILPLRYSAAAADKLADLSSLPALPGTLGDGVKDLSLSKAKYTVRMLRSGYLYVLIDRLGVKSWTSYYVTEDSYLYQFPPDTPPRGDIEFSCDPTNCGINAAMVAIPKAEDVQKAWFLFTPSPLTRARLAEYKSKADDYAAKKKMQTFSPAAWSTGATAQPHSMLPDVAEKTVAEYVLYHQNEKALSSSLGLAMERQLFPPDSSAYAGIDTKGGTLQPGRLGALMREMKRRKAASFVIYDHIGITQELNDFRNDAFQAIDGFMGKKDRNGIDNTYRFDVYHAIDQFRDMLEKGLVSDEENSIETRDLQRRARVEPIFPDDSAAMRTLKMQANNAYTHPSRKQWEAAHPERVQALEDARAQDEATLIEQARQGAQKIWKEKYATQLDENAMSSFIQAMQKASEQSRTWAAERTPDHLAWLKAARVLDAFDIYDQKDEKSGEALRAQAVGCIFGMEGSPEAEGILTEWATATSIKRENLLLRAFTRDQESVNKEADKTLAEVSALVAGMTEMSTLPATSWQKATKGLVSACKSTDSALDEWMRYQSQSKNYLNPKHIANVEARIFYLVSTLTRAVARKGMGGKLEAAVAARANALMYAWLGDLAQHIEFKALDASIDPAKWTDLKMKYINADTQAKASADRRTAQQRRAYRQAQRAKAALQNAAIDLISDAQLKAKLQISQGAKALGWNDIQVQLEESAKQHNNYKSAAAELEKKETLHSKRVPDTPSPTNNYHHVRIGAVMAGIESLSLLTKIPKLKGMDIALAEVAASACSLGSILLDMMYAYTKSVRELTKYAAIKGVKDGADIVRGGFKIGAGMLAAFAGLITAYLDLNAMEKEKDPIQRAILTARFLGGSGSSFFGALAAYSYSGPLLEHLAGKKGRSITLKRFFNIASEGAVALSKRVLLLRIVAWLGWVGVVITVADLAYAGYRWYMDVTALRRWFSRCVFRGNKSNQAYADVKEELKEFAKAQHPGQEVEDPDSAANNHQVTQSINVAHA